VMVVMGVGVLVRVIVIVGRRHRSARATRTAVTL